VIRLAAPDIDDADLAAVVRVLRSGHLVQGQEVAAFEAELASKVGSRFAIALNSCTSALHLGLLALGIKQGDEVAVPAYSWPATANVVVLCGATPVFIDVDPDYFALQPDLFEAQLRQRSRMKAVIPVHPFGAMASMERICEISAQHQVAVLEDAACALGAVRGGVPAGRWGVMGCYSFHPRKAITTGEGGAVVTDDEELCRKVRMLRNHGQDPDSARPDFVAAGFNLRLTELQAAVGRTQLAKLERLVDSRRVMARRYAELLSDSTIRSPQPRSVGEHVYQSFVVQLPPGADAGRDDVIAEMRARGIEAAIGTYHMPLLRYYSTRFGFTRGDFPVADAVASGAIALPLHAHLTADEQQRVVEALRGVTGL
jgi:dTDP-4-amino-4,6-dideoxygalactose transaminase